MRILDIIAQSGGVTRVARECGITHPTVSGWKLVPPHHVRTVARLAGIPEHVIRPDIFGPPPAEEAA